MMSKVVGGGLVLTAASFIGTYYWGYTSGKEAAIEKANQRITDLVKDSRSVVSAYREGVEKSLKETFDSLDKQADEEFRKLKDTYLLK